MKINIWHFTISIFILSVIAFLTDSIIFDSFVTIIYLLAFAFLIYGFMIYPLTNYFFGLLGYRRYSIRQGKHRTKLFYYKPMIFGGEYFIKAKVLTEFNDINLNTQQETQTNKLFGINYGLPILDKKTFTLIHANSIRLGFTLNKNVVNYCIYIRKDRNILTKYLEDDLDYIVLNTKKHFIEIHYESGKTEYFEYDKLIKTSKFGYYLSKPYFGGKEPAPKDIHFKYTVGLNKNNK